MPTQLASRGTNTTRPLGATAAPVRLPNGRIESERLQHAKSGRIEEGAVHVLVLSGLREVLRCCVLLIFLGAGFILCLLDVVLEGRDLVLPSRLRLVEGVRLFVPCLVDIVLVRLELLLELFYQSLIESAIDLTRSKIP